MSRGFVSLVGGGPGSADLLTLAAVRAIQSAEVILFDALLSADVRKLFPRRAKAVYVGKRCGQHALKQHEINQLLVDYALQGRSVVRLKGGDPFIFGRGGEEIEALRAHDIPYRIIPGISALNGVAAQWALPVTTRSHANEFRAIQGHHLPESIEYWRELARYTGTLIVFMGLDHIAEIAERMLAQGANPLLPVAIIETDSGGSQHLTRTDLLSLQARGLNRKTHGPGIIYMGSNVELMDQQSFAERESHHGLTLARFS